MFAKTGVAGVLLCSVLTVVLLAGCGRDSSGSREPSSYPETSKSKIKETAAAEEDAKATAEAQDETEETPAAAEEAEKDADNSKIIYEGRYFDEQWYQYVDMPAEESSLVYCEIIISNVTDTSFDFVINEEVMATGEITAVIPAGTAMIEDAGAKAVYKGDNLTLTFSFPDAQNTFPQHLEISGSEKLENNVYINNSIPGHESG